MPSAPPDKTRTLVQEGAEPEGAQKPKGPALDEATRASAFTPAPGVVQSVIQDRPQQSDELAPGTVCGAYVVESLLGSGGGGAVYSARHRILGRKAAVKVLRREMVADPHMVERFRREALAVNMIAHPNIVDIFEFGELQNRRPYYVMELLSGTDLRSLLDERGRFSSADALQILEPVCAALTAAHAVGIVHRDLKASNINYDDTVSPPVIKLLDFGIAKLMRPEPGMEGLTAVGMQLGSSYSMAPEQVRCAPVDARTDVYALGVLLFQLLTGDYPFRAEDRLEVERMHLETPPPRPSRMAPVSAAIDAVVLRCLEKDPSRRYDTVQIFLEALRATIAGQGAAAAAETVQATGVFVEARIGEGADDSDESILDDMMEITECANRVLTEAGFSIAVETGSSVLGVQLLAADADKATAVQTAHALAEQLWTELSERGTAHADVHVNVAVHLGAASVRQGTDGAKVEGGEIADPNAWAPKDAVQGVFATEVVRSALAA